MTNIFKNGGINRIFLYGIIFIYSASSAQIKSHNVLQEEFRVYDSLILKIDNNENYYKKEFFGTSDVIGQYKGSAHINKISGKVEVIKIPYEFLKLEIKLYCNNNTVSKIYENQEFYYLIDSVFYDNQGNIPEPGSKLKRLKSYVQIFYDLKPLFTD